MLDDSTYKCSQIFCANPLFGYLCGEAPNEFDETYSTSELGNLGVARAAFLLNSPM